MEAEKNKIKDNYVGSHRKSIIFFLGFFNQWI